jgi:diguanylate cyclase (GGDEF)-like protein
MGDAPLTDAEWWAPLLPEDRERLRKTLADAAANRLPEMTVSYRIRHPSDGSLRHLEARVHRDYDGEGRLLSALGVIIDVTERQEAEERIAHLARHDALTGLPNRLLFRERLDEAVARARRGDGFALLLIDLDRFKEVNDTLGHPVGDTLLRAVTGRLQHALRETDTLARLGGDEFAVIQAGVPEPEAAAALARRLVETLGTPFDLNGQQVCIGTSIGIAMAPADGQTADGLVRNADMALYRSKAEGRGCWSFFEPAMDAALQRRRTLEIDLRRALAEHEFELFYQPILDLRTGCVSGLEALLRWRHPERGLMAPDAFLPMAEEIGLIVPIGEWAIARACAEAATWPATVQVAVNLSPAQLGHRGLVDAVSASLAASGLAASRLELEITEKVLLKETEVTVSTLQRLQALGVRIALDDFGTGHSSLNHLRRLRFDKVKLDGVFTRELGRSPESQAIMHAVAGLCGDLAITPTAEGVETEAQLKVLLEEGYGEAQGYLFSPPRPAREIPAMLAGLGLDARPDGAADRAASEALPLERRLRA